MSDMTPFNTLLEKMRAIQDVAVIGATDAEISAANARLPVPIPSRWQQALRVGNGGEIRPRSYLRFMLWPAHQISADASSLLLIGEEPEWGNLLLLSPAEQTGDGDCPVRWVSPSGEDQGATWDSITAFLHWWLEEKE